MILSFKKQFSEPILKGTKIHTIREDKPNRWKPGNKIHFANGVRTQNYNCFKESVCISVQDIRIAYPVKGGFPIIIIDNKPLKLAEIKTLVNNDGFLSVLDFLDWFNKPFKGKIIHWTNKTY